MTRPPDTGVSLEQLLGLTSAGGETGTVIAIFSLRGLARGFSLVEERKSGNLVKRADQLAPGDLIKVRFQQGNAICSVEEIEHE